MPAAEYKDPPLVCQPHGKHLLPLPVQNRGLHRQAGIERKQGGCAVKRQAQPRRHMGVQRVQCCLKRCGIVQRGEQHLACAAAHHAQAARLPVVQHKGFAVRHGGLCRGDLQAAVLEQPAADRTAQQPVCPGEHERSRRARGRPG